MYCPLKQQLIAATKFSGFLGLKHYKKAKKIKHFNHLGLANWPQSFSTYHTICITYSAFRLPTKKAYSSYVMCVKLAFFR